MDLLTLFVSTSLLQENHVFSLIPTPAEVDDEDNTFQTLHINPELLL